VSHQGLANKYRPKNLSQIVGQDHIVSAIRQAVKRNAVPQTCLFCGDPGTGKTTTARILGGLVGALDSDIVEINAAEKRKLDDVRDLLARCGQAAFHPESTARVYILDEAHQLTKRDGGDAQTALLKRLEEPPPNVYFFLCSSEPNGLLPAIRSRCTTYKTKPIQFEDQKKLILRVCGKEDIKLAEIVVARIVEVAQGSGRDALKLLDQVAGLGTEDEQLEMLNRADAQTEGINLCRLLISPSARWDEVAKCLKSLEGDAEQVRRMILGYFSQVALGGGPLHRRAVLILRVFRDNYYDCGKGGLIADCFEVVHAGRQGK